MRNRFGKRKKIVLAVHGSDDLDVGTCRTTSSTMTIRPVMIPAQTTMQESRQARIAGQLNVRTTRMRARRRSIW